MSMHRAKFEDEGYAIVSNLVSAAEISELSQSCESLDIHKVGTRNLIHHEWVQALSLRIASHSMIMSLLPPKAKLVQCTYFKKSEENNWLVPLHRDISIPMKARFEARGWSGWSKKEGVWYAKPPLEVLYGLVAVRVHLERNSLENGALQVVPGSHRNLEIKNTRIACEVPAGGALVMHPLVLHSSSKLDSGSRTVLHFLYGPPTLPAPAEWP